ncbi:MAG: CapA family protein [Chloroflexi bacterium]|nr:CapA family protein [Chloroflexota bacterium]
MLALMGILIGKVIRSKAIQLPLEFVIPISVPTVMPAVTFEPAAPPPISRTRILFTGDITLGRCVAERTIIAGGQTGNFNHPFEFVAEELRAADLTVGSFDGSLSDEAAPMPCPEGMNLIGPTRLVGGLQFAGFDVLTAATNHIKDCGEKGFRCDNKSFLDTILTLRAADIQPTGVGNTLAESRAPVILERNGVRFAFLGINNINDRVWASDNAPGTAPLSEAHIEIIKGEIASAKQIADVVIVMPHWGVEYSAGPQEDQQRWAREFIDAGASLVIGNHPHIIHPMEMYSDRLIFYSLGNFVFDQGQDFQREGIVVEVNFIGAEIESWQLHPAKIDYFTHQANWAQGAEAEIILARATGK